MKYTFFICSMLLATGTFAQWNTISLSKFHELKISEANKKSAFYMGIPCEVKLASFKNKKLWLTSPNALVKEGASIDSYTVLSDTSEVLLQVYYMNKNKWVFLSSVSINCIDIPQLTELNIYGNEIHIGHNISSFLNQNYQLSPYDSVAFNQEYTVTSWAITFPFNKEFSGNGNLINTDALYYASLLPKGASYSIRAYYEDYQKEYLFQPSVVKTIVSIRDEQPASKYVILSNEPKNKSFFDEKDPNSLLGLLNNNYFIEKNLSKGILGTRIMNSKDASFIGEEAITGITPTGYSNGGRFTTDQLLDPKLTGFEKRVMEIEPQLFEKVALVNGEVVPVYVKLGSTSETKIYSGSQAEQIDSLAETVDPLMAELDPFGWPLQVVYRYQNLKFCYATENIDRIIIRYDSVINLLNGNIEDVPSRISLARFIGKTDTMDIVFSIRYTDLLSVSENLKKEFFAPTIHVRKDKSNEIYFDLSKKSSLLGYLQSIKEDLNTYNFPYVNKRDIGYFGYECELNGKLDSTLFEIEVVKDPYEFEKVIMVDGNAMPVYNKEGFSTDTKVYNLGDLSYERLDDSSETINPTEAALDEFGPIPVLCQLQENILKQFEGITDLFIKQQYVLDAQLGVIISKPTHLGFARQMPGQTKPTLIIEIPLANFPGLMNKLPSVKPQLFLNQPWVVSIIQNEVQNQGEIILGSDLKTLQKRFYFNRNLVSIDGDVELSSKPHF